MINLKESDLIKLAVKNKEGQLTNNGVFYTETGEHTGRSPKGKRIVSDDLTNDIVDWKSNKSILPVSFNQRLKSFMFFKNNMSCYQQDVWAVRNPKESISVRIFTQYAKHSLFARNMFIPHDRSENKNKEFTPEWEIYQFPSLFSQPMVWISFKEKKILISGTTYAGEAKKSIFTVLNYIYPQKKELPMHCSVNINKEGKDPAIFFGLSGTGKTTLSSDRNRILIGDDEHAWSLEGITNFEGGCYAKTINLTKESEPQIYDACFKKSTMLENVVVKNGEPDFFDASLTQNGRASYPISSIEGSHRLGYVKEQPKNIIMLTCDAFGVLPPVAKLSPEEASEQFLLGYTSKVAGTEKGVKEPTATFSHCFGAPFMPLKPQVYGDILKQKVKDNKVNCWLVNTGWSGGEYGKGKRMPLKVTRKIIDKILDGTINESKFKRHKYTDLSIPKKLNDKNVDKYLSPEKTWKNIEEYKEKVSVLMNMFKEQKSKLDM